MKTSRSPLRRDVTRRTFSLYSSGLEKEMCILVVWRLAAFVFCSTHKTDFKAFINFTKSTKKRKLILENFNPKHDHPCTSITYCGYPEVRRLWGEKWRHAGLLSGPKRCLFQKRILHGPDWAYDSPLRTKSWNRPLTDSIATRNPWKPTFRLLSKTDWNSFSIGSLIWRD